MPQNQERKVETGIGSRRMELESRSRQAEAERAKARLRHRSREARDAKKSHKTGDAKTKPQRQLAKLTARSRTL